MVSKEFSKIKEGKILFYVPPVVDWPYPMEYVNASIEDMAPTHRQQYLMVRRDEPNRGGCKKSEMHIALWIFSSTFIKGGLPLVSFISLKNGYECLNLSRMGWNVGLQGVPLNTLRC